MEGRFDPVRRPPLAAPLTLLLLLSACSRSSAGPSTAASTAPDAEHAHELHLPPAGPTVTVALDGKTVDVALASLKDEGAAVPLAQLWKAAFPSQDPASLRFDLVGVDGFRPMSRPKCTHLLGAGELAAGRIDVATHDVSFDDAASLPGCYRVKGTVRLEASHTD